jgi:YidC/Oxa1 family membrane protein insertase
MDKKSNLIFIVVAALGLLGYMWLGNYLWPTKPPQPKEPPPAAETAEKPKPPEKPKEAPPEGAKPPAAQEPPPDPEMLKPVVLGGENGQLTVTLDPHGAGVGRIVANHFQEATAMGRPAWEEVNGKKVAKPLELVPQDTNAGIASYLLYHYRNPDEDFPLDTLGKRVWKRLEPEKVEDGQVVRRAVFQTTVRGVRITKTYTLEPAWYHVGLEVKLELADPKAGEKEFRYQLTGAHGLLVEGEWFTGTFRNALIGRVDANDAVDRNMQVLQQIAAKGGGDSVVRGDGSIRYAGVAVQYFASVLAADPRAPDNAEARFFDPNPIGEARPILMEEATKGTIVNKPLEGDAIVLLGSDRKESPKFFFANPGERERFQALLSPGREVIVVHRTDIALSGESREVVSNLLDASATAPLFHDDITVAVSTPKDKAHVVKLRPGEPVIHRYVLYNGPVKVKLLNHLSMDQPVGGEGAGPPVPDDVLKLYLDDLRLKTLTDYPSSFLGREFNRVGLTDIVIWLTNVMHSVLWLLYSVVQYVLPPVLAYGVCIVLLTVLVRGAMFPVSRKQALTSLRMQELAPELKKLQEKHKDNKQALGLAQMELYRKHGVNPMGSCWMIFLQMPVFLGLYYALQESIHFRLAPFLWIQNLAAPDMLVWWGTQIPWVSRWQDYGWILYLGPYFNLLPVLAVGLMIVQQKMTLPPATDEQTAMQQKMMKYMMIFMGVMFYKVAAGLCLYFIASSLWGFAERKLLPKKRKDGTFPAGPERKPGLMHRLLLRLDAARRDTVGTPGRPAETGITTAPAAASPVTAQPPAAPGRGKKKRGRDRKRADGRPAGPPAGGVMNGARDGDGAPGGVRGWWAGVRGKMHDLWAEILKQAEKK